MEDVKGRAPLVAFTEGNAVKDKSQLAGLDGRGGWSPLSVAVFFEYSVGVTGERVVDGGMS